MFTRMQKHGIFTVEQLCELSKMEMKNIWNGIVGERFWHWLRGDDLADISTQRRTVGHSHVLPPDLRTLEGAYAVVQKLLHKAARRLRMMNYWAGALSVFVKFIEQEAWEAKISLVECQDDLTLLEGLHTLWKECPEGEPLAVGITLFDLVPTDLHTLSLFEDPKRHRLSQAIDAINAKFGTDTIYFGGAHEAKHAAPTRIAFTNIPDLF
jgi:DNA polymerase-4